MGRSTEIQETAAAWLAKRDSGKWSTADEASLATWLDASTAHRVAFLRLEAAWRQADRLPALGAGPASGHRESQLRRTILIRRAWRIAAALIVGSTLALSWSVWAPAGPSYRTAVGALDAVRLSDGSSVTLNTATEIRVAVSETERRVQLIRGEAFFEVAPDAKGGARPFVVQAGRERIVVVGTQFAVRRNGDGVRVVVAAGRVRLERSGRQAPQAPPAELAAGSVARSSIAGVLIQEKSLSEVEEYLSWRSGYLVFRDTALADAVAELNRYNRRQIAIDDPTVAAIRIGGNFRSTNVDAFVALLEEGLPIRVERRDDQIVLKSSQVLP